MFFRYQHKSLQELVEIGEEEETDWGVIVLGTILLISILIYTSYMSYHNQELLQAIKKNVSETFRSYLKMSLIC